MKVRVGDLRPNPFRHYDRYPLQPAKLAALKESLHKTGFWDNVVARPVEGGAEIAYGHHRLAALREVYGPEQIVEVIARDLDDATMLQIMARENMEEWGTSFWVEMETVAAVIDAYDAGKIELAPPSSRTSGTLIRWSRRATRPYTAATVARFLGWLDERGRVQAKVDNALTALEFIERGLLDEGVFSGLGNKQAEAVIAKTRETLRRHEQEVRAATQDAERAHREAEEARDAEQREMARRREEAARARAAEEAREALGEAAHQGRTVADAIRSGEIGYREARDYGAAEAQEGPPRELSDIARRLASEIGRILDEDRDVERVRRLNLVLLYREDLKDWERDDLARTLDALAQRAAAFAAGLRQRPAPVRVVR